MRSKSTVEYLGVWEFLNNPDFKRVDFEAVKNEAGTNSFVLTPKKWVENTNAIGITSKSGRYGGTYAHPDIAFEFASWISPEFKLYIIQDYQRLKEEQSYKNQIEWQANRYISKLNYSIHTDAIKEKLITPKLTKQQVRFTYANEADILNVALYGKTAKQWKVENPDKEGNIRDHSTIEQLLILNNLQSINAQLINEGITQSKRLEKLNEVAIMQSKTLINSNQKALNDLKELQ